MPTARESTRHSAESRCRACDAGAACGDGRGRAPAPTAARASALTASLVAAFGRRGRARRLVAGLVLLAATSACVVGRQPWVAPGVRVLYRAEGAGRAGIRFLVAREANELAITRTPSDAGPAYDRGTGWVYFASQEGGSWDLYRVRLSGEERTRLTATPDVDERWPALAPEGDALFFTSDAGGTDQIYRAALDASDAAPVTSGQAPHSRAAVDSSGTFLVALEGEEAELRLVRIDIASGSATRLEGAQALPPAGRLDVSRDGSVAYACRGPAGLDICVLPPNGAARRVTEHGAEDRDPVWSPDGSAIVFSSGREDGNLELYLMRADGSRIRRLTKEKGDDVQPFWVP